MEETSDWGSTEYFIWVGVLVFSRGMDFLSTWIATPHLILEANPIARKLGWKWGAAVNGLVCLGLGVLPMGAIAVSTTSLLVAAHNFQSAWLMRTLGEEAYRDWYIDRLQAAPTAVYLFCLLGQTSLVGVIGVALVLCGAGFLVPLGIGLGMIIYALTLAFYTLLSLWRIRRSSR